MWPAKQSVPTQGLESDEEHHETRGEVVAGGDGDGTAGYFQYDFRDDEIPVEGTAGAWDVDGRRRGRQTLDRGQEEFCQAAAQAEVAAAEKEAKMKMCKYSPDLSIECSHFCACSTTPSVPFLSASTSGGGHGITAEEEQGLIII